MALSLALDRCSADRGKSAKTMELGMRSQNVGIVGLALVGVAFLAPQQAMAYASYSVNVDTSTSASLSGPGSLAIRNYYSGINVGGYYTDFGGTSTLSNDGNSVSGPGSSVSGDFDILLQGVATNGDTARASYRSNENVSRQTLGNANTLGTVVTVTGLTSASDLSLDMTLEYLLDTATSTGSTTYADLYWTVTYQTRTAGTSTWSNWGPNCAAGAGTTYFCGATPFGDANTGEDSLPFGTAGGSGFRNESGVDDYDITTTLAANTDYRFRLALAVRGIANSVATPPPAPVPLPAALPMLGAAMAGLGLFAARRRKS